MKCLNENYYRCYGRRFCSVEIVKGANLSAKEFPCVEFILVGDETEILNCFKKLECEVPKNISIVHTDVFVTMEDDPMIVMKEKNNSSMAIALKMLKDDCADALISAGSTGALHTASSLIVRRIKGIRRSAIASILPFKKPILMLDSGANPTVTEDILNQWAIIGSAYSCAMFGIDKPTVGLLNNGTEEHKGTPVAQAAYQLLKANEHINFIGNVESKEIPNSPCDVLITDGFTGNIVLKFAEGMGSFMFSSLKTVFTSSITTKLSFLMIKKHLKSFKNTFNASTYGGAPLLGLTKPVIKAHGNSKADSIVSAVRQAINYSSSNIIDKVVSILEKNK